jgi:hypothetical protein
VKTNECALALTEAPLAPEDLRVTAMETVFESFQFMSLYTSSCEFTTLNPVGDLLNPVN